jgi:hypothetical protein
VLEAQELQRSQAQRMRSLQRSRAALLDGSIALRRPAAGTLLRLCVVSHAPTPGDGAAMTQYSPLLALAAATAILFLCIGLTLLAG